MMKYESYSNIELNEILTNPRSVASDPYKLFIATVLCDIYEYINGDDCEDEMPPIQNIWYSTIPQTEFKQILDDCFDDFVSAVNGKLRIDINGQSYTIRNIDKLNISFLKGSFDFVVKDGNCYITPEGIKNVLRPTLTTEVINANRTFAMKIWYHGNSSDDGWQDLTEMEVAVYFWLRYIRRNKGVPDIKDVLRVWFDKYHRSFFVGYEDIKNCLQDPDGKVRTAFSFSADKVQRFNITNDESTYLDNVDIGKAKDYWYETLNL